MKARNPRPESALQAAVSPYAQDACRSVQVRQDHAVDPSACHEAGHAVVARHLGLFIHEANYTHGESGAGSGGVLNATCGVFDAYVSVAGYVAEWRAAGRRASGYIHFVSSNDYDRLRELLAPWLANNQSEAYEQKLEDDVAGFLYQPDVWKCVRRFARELMRSNHLSFEDCMRLTNEVPRARLVETQQTMLNPTFHNHMKRRIGSATRLKLEKLLREAVRKLRPAFRVPPPMLDDQLALLDKGYPGDEVKRLILDMYGFWLDRYQPR